jgi:hypothetical protein
MADGSSTDTIDKTILNNLILEGEAGRDKAPDHKPEIWATNTQKVICHNPRVPVAGSQFKFTDHAQLHDVAVGTHLHPVASVPATVVIAHRGTNTLEEQFPANFNQAIL